MKSFLVLAQLLPGPRSPMHLVCGRFLRVLDSAPATPLSNVLTFTSSGNMPQVYPSCHRSVGENLPVFDLDTVSLWMKYCKHWTRFMHLERNSLNPRREHAQTLTNIKLHNSIILRVRQAFDLSFLHSITCILKHCIVIAVTSAGYKSTCCWVNLRVSCLCFCVWSRESGILCDITSLQCKSLHGECYKRFLEKRR